MEDNSPYQASLTPPPISAKEQRPAIEVPGEITRPIKYLWVMGFIMSGVALLVALIVFNSMYQGFKRGDVAGLAVILAVGGLFLDAVVYAGLSWGIRRKSRAAACILFGYYLVGQALFTMQNIGSLMFRLSIMAIVLIFLYRGTRATFAYHRHVTQRRSEA